MSKIDGQVAIEDSNKITIPFSVLVVLMCLASLGLGLVFGLAIWG